MEGEQMRYLLLIHALCLTALFAQGAVSDERQPIIVTYDGGGNYHKYRRIVRHNPGAEIRGQCFSACTMYLSMDNVCITRKAEFWFHQVTIGGVRTWSHTRVMYRSYPKWVRDYIDANGGLGPDWIIMPNSYAAKYLPKCP